SATFYTDFAYFTIHLRYNRQTIKKQGGGTRVPSEPREYQICNLVQEFQISPRTIRYYEGLGLVEPGHTTGNHRIYSRRDRARLKMILRGKMLGFSLQEIAVLIQLYDIDPTEKRQYEEGLRYAYKHLEEVCHRIAELKSVRGRSSRSHSCS
ncbi:MAG: MerR family transcriptional regulator, partial [Alicyclobacillaceae bacterium]|nr:MerR family transcriptional regulator [Alicyclobacillaceae bacterium]